jgi:hypothetical protein
MFYFQYTEYSKYTIQYVLICEHSEYHFILYHNKYSPDFYELSYNLMLYAQYTLHNVLHAQYSKYPELYL